MPEEGLEFDQKSIRYVLGRHQDAEALACDCVGLANARGGIIFLGLEDGSEAPPAGQAISDDLIRSLQRRLPQLTVNVQVAVSKRTHANGAEYVRLEVARNGSVPAATTDGRYFIRVADQTQRLMPDQLSHLMSDRSAFHWEFQRGPEGKFDAAKQRAFLGGIRASDRVKDSVKAKSDQELLGHYDFIRAGQPTNLGVLWLGTAESRSALGNAPVIQAIKYDEREEKVRKWSWDDHSLNPAELIEAVWKEIPDWQESYELPDGMYRQNIPHYDEKVVRELLVNALAHRPYTTAGNLHLNLYPDRLEVHNPGLLPIGVTPSNILHASQQRNPGLVRVFHDLKLMEREGSGFDLLYRLLLSTGRRPPEVQEGRDRVVVRVFKRIIQPEIVDFIQKVEKEYRPTLKEVLVLGTLAQHESLTTRELAKALELSDAELLDGAWIGRLDEWGLVTRTGRTKGTRYQVEPEVLRKTEFKGPTSLRRIEDHRLRELVLEDLRIYKKASRQEIHAHIGAEIPTTTLIRILDSLVASGTVSAVGNTKGRKYLLPV